MTIRGILMSAMILGLSSAAFAQSGTPEQRAACASDVRRFCHKLTEQDGSSAYLQCLQAHRERLSKPCHYVLESNGV
ncbi:MAG: hypothetical protein ABR970_14730 [Roseiarcus sp.]|jgi:hypothetical protein